MTIRYFVAASVGVFCQAVDDIRYFVAASVDVFYNAVDDNTLLPSCFCRCVLQCC